MKKLLFIFGTRPEAIKMLPIVNYAREHYIGKFEVKVCVTGQHRQMLDQVLSLFEVVPDYDLDIMAHGQDLYDVTSKVLLGLRPVLADFKPDCVLVHGDTTTTLASSLAAYYQRIPVAHVEAGLRTHDIYSPWPEEINRTLTGAIAEYHFAPTEVSKANLLRENITKNVEVVGNTVIDSLLWTVNKIEANQDLNNQLTAHFTSLGLDFSKRMILITGHRRENFGQVMSSHLKALRRFVERHSDVELVFPVHPNPSVRTAVDAEFSGAGRIHCIEPLEYTDFLHLLSRAWLVASDSGGVQEEAPSLGKPLLVLRDTTERPEVLDCGVGRLVGHSGERLEEMLETALVDESWFDTVRTTKNPFGKGDAGEQIASAIERFFTTKTGDA